MLKIDEIKYLNGQLEINAPIDVEEYSVHIWRIDEIDVKNRERLLISGWTTVPKISFQISFPGTYFVKYFTKDGLSKFSNELHITLEDIHSQNENTSIAATEELILKKIEAEEQLMQKMYIVGMDAITNQLEKTLDNKNLSIFADSMNDMRIGNMIIGQSFFEGGLPIKWLLSNNTTKIGYKISASFRMDYEMINKRLKELNESDVILDIDVHGVSEIESTTKNKLRENGVQIISLRKIVTKAYNEKFVLGPLRDLKKQGVSAIMVRFPRLKEVENKTESEEKSANLAIKVLRENLKKNIYPEVYKELGVNEEYIDDVLSGWQLVSHPEGYDTLKDKSSKYVNIVNGQRVVNTDPEHNLANKLKLTSPSKLYFFGNSVMFGIGSDDDYTIPNLIAQKVPKYSVENKANFSMSDVVRGINLAKHTKYNKGDVVVFGSHLNLEQDEIDSLGAGYINLQDAYNRPHDYGEVFVDMTHMTKNGYQIAADTLYDFLKKESII